MPVKVGKAEARYQAHARGIQRCELCSMFVSPHACTKVAGDISPRGWSKFFDWKDAQTHARARREHYDRTTERTIRPNPARQP